MIYPPIFQICAANAALVDLVGDSDIVRVFPFGEAERIYGGQVPTPYVVWQQVGGSPENMLDTAPDADTFSVQFDVYAKTAGEARAVGEALRDAIEPHCYITSWRGDGRDFETRLCRFSFDADWMTERAVPVSPVDKSALVAALDAAAELNEEDYTPESWAVLADAVDAGQIVYDDDEATQMQVDAAAQAIFDAISGLVPVEIGCAFPLSGDAAGLLPGLTPYIISGADSQTVSTGVDPQQPYYIATSSITTPFDVDWPADEVRWFKSVPISEAWDVVAENVSYLRSHHLGITSLVDLSQILVRLYRESFIVGEWTWTVEIRNSSGRITAEYYPEKPTALYFGADGLGRAWVRVGSWIYRTDETFNTSQCGVTLTTEFVSGSGIGEASARLETDASTFDVFPDLSSVGINSQTDLCGNPVEVAPP